MLPMDPFQLEIFYDFIILDNLSSVMQPLKPSTDPCHPGLIVGMKKFFSEDLVQNKRT